MKKVLLSLLLFSFSSTVFADNNTLNLIKNEDKVFYSQENSIWLKEPETNNEQILTKTLFEGAGSYSIYNKEDGSLAFALATDCELINNGKLIIVDNNILKYYKLEYNDGSIEQIGLTDEEIQGVFPEAEIFKLSQIESDNKIWLHKPFRKERTLILVNDTDKFFHGINCKSKNVQNPEIKGLIKISRYGIIRFTHFGEYKGNLTFYIR